MSVEILKEKAIKRMGAGMKALVLTKVLEIIEQAYKEGIYVLITDGYRSKAEQDALYAQGRTKPGKIVTNAKGGQSNHNFGIAVDFCLTNEKGTIANYTVNSNWRRVAAIAKSKGFEWGGDWKGFVDNPHLEYTGKITVEPEETKVESVIVTTPNKPDTDGDTNIKKLQTFLNGYTKKANFTKLVVDGYKGPKTKTAAIRVFQYFSDVTIDGVFGKKSKAAAPTLKKGTTWSKWTRLIQGMLYYNGFNPQGIDGVFGNDTLAAVKAFQKANGLVADGIVGPATFVKFFE
ncbi:MULTISPECIES: peptidoglycan-binding protein [unclassified Niallia]|uniref:peptidoglycan-binding protein n=1 Tax=unclassified Niallia TaxID=2837522 RepID=UPI002559F8CC|nr:peptidoglycan-binding protein [Niallia sp. MER 6]